MLCHASSTDVDFDSGEGRLQLSWPQRHKLAEAIMFSARRYEVIGPSSMPGQTKVFTFYPYPSLLALSCRCGEAMPKYAGYFIRAFVRAVATRPPCYGSEEVASSYSPSH